MAEIDGRDQLLEVFPRFLLGELAARDACEELAAADVLDDDEDFGFGGEDLFEVDYVGVPDESHDGDLVGDLVDDLGMVAFGLFFVYDFDGDGVVCG